MAILDNYKRIIISELGLDKAGFSCPPSVELGDLSLACFEIAKANQKNPADLAKEWAEKLSERPAIKKYFSAVKAAGPYLNFYLATSNLAESVISAVKKQANLFGNNDRGQDKSVMIEYSNGNTHKEYHVGHLRNISYGDAIYRLLSANGYRVIPVSYINDFGIHVAKTIWNWQRNSAWSSRSENKGYLLGKCYAEASQELIEHPEFKEEVSKIMKGIESRHGVSYDLWQTTRRWSIKYFAAIYRELSIKFRHIFYENEVIDSGLKLVDELVKKGILVKSEGAIIANLEKYDLGVLPVIRSDGTALYPVADLALASEKFNKYKLDQSVYVVDVRQSLYFKQLFKVLELIGYHQPMIHLAYDFVTLPEGMMASRTGNVITYEDLRDKLLAKLIKETKERHDDWAPTRVEQVAMALTVSTIKFEMLKTGAEKIITFNIEEAAKFDGYTACYLQYGYARLKSIIRKGNGQGFFNRPNLHLLQDPLEKGLLLKLAKYEETVAAAGEKYNPSELAKYLFELTQLVNDYYHRVNILKAEPAVRRARLALVKSIAQVLANGFKILGLKVLEEM
jgi:arginyl-tRNA synthetase